MTSSRWLRVNRRVLLVASLVLAAVSAVALADPDGTAASNGAAARADATRLLSWLSLPAGATQSSGEPAGDHGVLAGPSSFPVAVNLVDLHQWWLVDGSPRSVLAYIEAHRPRGSRQNESGIGSGGTSFLSAGYGWPADLRVLASRELIMTAVGLSGGRTGLRVDAQDVWMTPRPSSEQIGSDVTRLRVTVTRGSRRLRGPFTYTSATKLHAVIKLLNSLPAAQPGAESCPADWGSLIRLRLYGAGPTEPVAVANVDPRGCGRVTLTLAGRREPPLASWPIPGHPHTGLVKLLERDLRARLAS